MIDLIEGLIHSWKGPIHLWGGSDTFSEGSMFDFLDTFLIH